MKYCGNIDSVGGLSFVQKASETEIPVLRPTSKPVIFIPTFFESLATLSCEFSFEQRGIIPMTPI